MTKITVKIVHRVASFESSNQPPLSLTCQGKSPVFLYNRDHLKAGKSVMQT